MSFVPLRSGSLPIPLETTSHVPASSPAAKTLPVPTLKIDTSYQLDRPLPPLPTLGIDPAKRTSVRFRRTTLSPQTFDPYDDGNYDRERQQGLGINGTIFQSDASPIKTPAIEIMEEGKKNRDDAQENVSSNLAQRIEEKLWVHSASNNVAKRWLLEIISLAVSAICMGAIVGMLLVMQDKPTPRWPAGLTLNACVSELSKIASAALLLPVSEALGQLKWLWFQDGSKKMWDFEIFDNATGGPWGAFLLLLRTKGTTLAALGAGITVFSMALDPFFQQTVNYPHRTVLSTTLNSTIPKVFKYQPAYDMAQRGGVEMMQMEQDLQAVALRYLYNEDAQPLPFGKDVRPDIPLSCPTSNCTWPDYETLGICSACEDITDLLTYDCLTGPLDWIANVSYTIANTTEAPKYENGTMCGWFINATTSVPPTRPVLMSGYRKASPSLPFNEALLTRVLPLVRNPSRKPLYGTGSYHFKNVTNPILDFFVASAADTPDSVYGKTPPVAQECMLAWCVKTLRSTYFEANYTEKATRTFMNTTSVEYPWKSVPTMTEFGPGFDQTYSRDIRLDYNGTQYGASMTAHSRTVYVFDDYFPSVFLRSNESDTSYLRYKMQYTAGPPFLRNISYNPFLAPNNVTHHMQRMAQALTDVLRSSNQHEWVDGQVFNDESFVQVRWAWLSLPLGLLAFSTIFLIGTVVQSSLAKDNIGAWKTSAVAILLYGLPDEMQRKITEPAPGSAMRTPRAKAKELKVKMLPKTGWRVSDSAPPPYNMKVKPNEPPPGWI